MEELITYYEVLEVAESATDKEIKKAYRRLSQEYHPDKVPSHLSKLRKDAEEKFKQIQEASDVLSHPDKRKEYDARLKELRNISQHAITENQNGDPVAHPVTPDTVTAPWNRVDLKSFREMLTAACSISAWIFGFIMSSYSITTGRNIFVDSGTVVAFVGIVVAMGLIAERALASFWTLLLGGITLIGLHAYFPKLFLATQWALTYGLLAYLLAKPLYQISRGRAHALSVLGGVGAVAFMISITLWGYNKGLNARLPSFFRADPSVSVDLKKSIKKGDSKEALENKTASERKKNGKNNSAGEGSSANVLFPAESIRFKVKIKSLPSGAEVMIDKKERGITPLWVVLEKGPHGIAIKKEGYQTTFDMLETGQNSEKEVLFALRRKTEE